MNTPLGYCAHKPIPSNPAHRDSEGRMRHCKERKKEQGADPFPKKGIPNANRATQEKRRERKKGGGERERMTVRELGQRVTKRRVWFSMV